jgi:predicted dehydrogenase
MPEGVAGASLGEVFWNVLFKYPGYTVAYESGYHNLPLFDAHIEVYGEDKSIRMEWDTPFIRGLPVSTTTRQVVNGGLQETHMRKTYEDPFILELKELYAMVTEDKAVKTSAEDAVKDIHIWQMIMRAAAS